MARSDSFARKWASAPAQFERPSNTLIARGWAGGAGEDPPEAKWENWWHNRVDEALAEIESQGALQWFLDVSYRIGATCSHDNQHWIAAKPSIGIEPGSAADVGHWQRKPLGTRAFMHISSSQAIPDSFEGMALIDASAGVVTVTLPASIAELGIRDVILRRVDNTGNRLVIQASGTDRIKFHTHLRAEGYPFLVLMGAGDYWHLRSDGAGNWWPIARYDQSPLGSYRDTAGAIIPPGGYTLPTGTVQAVDYPWLADYAQQSGAICDVAERTPKDGRWSISADGQTIYLPSPGSAFRRPHDLSGARALGTYQGDAIRNITGTANSSMGGSGVGLFTSGSGAFAVSNVSTDPVLHTTGSSDRYRGIVFDSSRAVPTAEENRPENITAYQLLKII